MPPGIPHLNPTHGTDTHPSEDYKQIDVLDQYEEEHLDDRRHEEMDHATRMRVEVELDRRQGIQRNMPGFLQDDDDDDGERDDSHRSRFQLQRPDGGEEDDGDEEGIFNLENFDAPIKEWVAQDRPRAEIKRRFCNFLENFVDAHNNAVHLETINQMCASNGQSLEISYQHLSQGHPNP